MLIQRGDQVADIAETDVLGPFRESGRQPAPRMTKCLDMLMPAFLHPRQRFLQTLVGIRLIKDGLNAGTERFFRRIRLKAPELQCQLLQTVLHHAIIAVFPQDGSAARPP